MIILMFYLIHNAVFKRYGFFPKTICKTNHKNYYNALFLKRCGFWKKTFVKQKIII